MGLLTALFCLFAVCTAQIDESEIDSLCTCENAAFGVDMMEGEMKSPNHPGWYCDNLNCLYEIEPRPGMAVNLVIESFQTEQRHDWLDVEQTLADLPTVESKFRKMLMGRLSGQEQTLNGKRFVTALNNGIHLTFHSDASERQFSGFRASFTRFSQSPVYAPCPTPYHEVNSLTKTVTLVGPARSLSPLECYYMVNQTEILDGQGWAVQLNVTQVAADAEVRVFETDDISRMTIASAIHRKLYVGRDMNGLNFTMLYNVDERSFTSHGSSVFVLFKPRVGALARIGTEAFFSAEATLTKSPCACWERAPKLISDTTSGSTTVVTSPGYVQGREYCDNLRCQVDVEGRRAAVAPNMMPVLKITFDTFDLEPNLDTLVLSVYDEMQTVPGAPLMKLSGIIPNGTVLTLPTSRCRFTFDTDSSVTRPGFQATVQQIDRDRDCRCPLPQPTSNSQISGSINFNISSDRIKKGCGYIDCFWKIHNPSSGSDFMKLRIVMKLRYKLQRIGEFIDIRTGDASFAPPSDIRTSSGMPVIEHERFMAQPAIAADGFITRDLEFSNNNEQLISVWFHSAWDSEAVGAITEARRSFDLQFEFREKCTCGDGQLRANPEKWQQLTSPDYPSNYCDNLRCNYVITAPDRHIILLNITFLQTEQNEDYLLITDGPTIIGTRIGRWTGVVTVQNIQRSTGQNVHILFFTDTSVTHTGYSLMYTAESLDKETAKEEEAARADSEKAAGKAGGESGPMRSVLVVLLIAIVVGAGVVLFMHRRGDLSLGPTLDAFLGGGSSASAPIGQVNGGTANQGYRPFAAQSQTSLVNEDE